jgi:MFS family permease
MLRAVTAPTHAAERRLVLVIGAIVFVDTMFYAAIAPLLPDLAHQLHLSKLSAGTMTAAYPAGTLVGALPGGMLAARYGPKLAVIAGLTLLAASTLAFGLLDDAAALDAARFAEGLGGACSWAGGIAWIVAEAPMGRRGALIGSALGAAIGGALFGPVIGTIATAAGRAATFSGVVVISGALILQARRLPSPKFGTDQGVRAAVAALRDRPIAVGMWLVALPALASGMVNVLGPLRLHRFGGSAAAIGATFLVAAALEAMLSPVIGGLSDRRGRLVPLRFGLIAATAVLLCFTLPRDAFLLAVVIVAIACALSAFWAPAMAMLSDAADAHGLDQGLAAALMNLAWATGQIGGSGFGGAAAKAVGDGFPMIVVSVLCAATLVMLARWPRRAWPARPRPHGRLQDPWQARPINRDRARSAEQPVCSTRVEERP